MNGLTQNDIEKTIKRHLGFAIFLAIVPILFIKFATYFSGMDDSLVIYLIPFSTVTACSYLIKCVLTEINEICSRNT